MSSLQYSYVKRWRVDMKSALVYASGGKCSVCSYSRCESGLEFHHIDPSEKDFAISAWKSLNTGSITDEVSKCILVCCRCHREIHANMVSINTLSPVFDKNAFLNRYNELKNIHSIPCTVCGTPTHSSSQYCSRLCINIAKGNIVWDKETLYDYIINKKMTFKEISIKYKVSINSIKYYAIKFGIYMPITKNISYNRKSESKKPDIDTLTNLVSSYTLTDIGRQFGVSCTSVRKWCKSYKMDIHKFKSFTYDDLLKCYNDKMIKSDILKQFGIGKERLNAMCKKHNLVFASPNIKYSVDIVNKVIDMRNSGVKFKDISLALKLTQSTVHHLYQKRNNT